MSRGEDLPRNGRLKPTETCLWFTGASWFCCRCLQNSLECTHSRSRYEM